jgi:hypothetical protein
LTTAAALDELDDATLDLVVTLQLEDVAAIKQQDEDSQHIRLETLRSAKCSPKSWSSIERIVAPKVRKLRHLMRALRTNAPSSKRSRVFHARITLSPKKHGRRRAATTTALTVSRFFIARV